MFCPTHRALLTCFRGDDSVGIVARRETVSSARWASLSHLVIGEGGTVLARHGPPAPVEVPLYLSVSGRHLTQGNLVKNKKWFI